MYINQTSLFSLSGLQRVSRAAYQSIVRQQLRSGVFGSYRSPSVSINSNIRGLSQVSLSLSKAFGMTLTMHDSLTKMQNINQKINDLLQNADRLSLGEIEEVNTRLSELVSELESVRNTSYFNGVSLLNNSLDGLQVFTDALGRESISFEFPNFDMDSSLDWELTSVSESDIQQIPNSTTSGTGSFSFSSSWSTGLAAGGTSGTGRTIETADLDGDGNLDIVTVSVSGTSASVQLGNGDGSFGSVQTYATGSSGRDILLIDINNDNKLDLITVDGNDDTLSILTGVGDGTFNARTTIAATGIPTSVTSGDFDEDGEVDLVVTYGKASSGVYFYTGNGDGTFNSPTTITQTLGSSPTSVEVGDFDDDGNLDFVLANSNASTVSLFSGDGTGSFAAEKTYSVGASPQGIAVSDLDGDGKDDLVVTNTTDGTATVLTGTGSQTLSVGTTYSTGSSPIGVLLKDIDGDSNLDMIVANEDVSEAVISILTGNGDGTFNARTTYSTSTLDRVNALAIGDFDGDGVNDIIAHENRDQELALLLGDTTTAVTYERKTEGYYTNKDDLLESVADLSAKIKEALVKVDDIHSRLEYAYGQNVGFISGGLGLLSSFATAEAGNLKPSEILDLADLVSQEIHQSFYNVVAAHNFDNSQNLLYLQNILKILS